MCPRPNPLRIKRAASGRCQQMLLHFTGVGQGPAQSLALDAGVDKSERAEKIPPEVDYRRGRVEQRGSRDGGRAVGPTRRPFSMQLQSRAGFPTTVATQLPLPDVIRKSSSPVGTATSARCEASPRRSAGRTNTQPVFVSRRLDDARPLESPQVRWRRRRGGLMRVMSETRSEGRNGGRPHRPGVCHRCGWSGSVSKVMRADRRRMKMGRAFGRLCDECTDVLLGRPSADTAVSQPRKSKLVHRRNVA